MNQNTVSGSARQSHTTAQGLRLERGYIYLTPELWQSLNAASRAAGMSASQHLAALLSAEKRQVQKELNDRTCPSH